MNQHVYDMAAEQWQDEEGSADLVAHFDTSDKKHEAEQMVAGLVAGLDKHTTVVDLGCGPGRYASALPTYRTYKGYDTSPHLLAAARAANKGRKGVRFFERDLFAGAPYKKAVDVVLSIDTSRHYRDPLAMLAELVELWPARCYVFSILHGPDHAELINGVCLATADVDAWMSRIGPIPVQIDQPITGGMSVRYFVLEPGA
jgi:SAM-dependent methyltransferase